MITSISLSFFFFFNDTATTEIYTLSLHDALPICARRVLSGDHQHHGWGTGNRPHPSRCRQEFRRQRLADIEMDARSEEHTSELQSPDHLVCRLLLEKKKKQKKDG